jgi:glycosyltransferase involved in cell wall biosynthesis
MHTSKVSILLPCFNGQPFLRECIESLLKQTHSNWQAIVLDSYSTDGSWQFLRSVAAGDSRFQLYQIPRDGLYAALNRGIQLATGEFLHIATVDDKIRPEFLETLLDLLGACPEAGIAACDVRLIAMAATLLLRIWLGICPRRPSRTSLAFARYVVPRPWGAPNAMQTIARLRTTAFFTIPRRAFTSRSIN